MYAVIETGGKQYRVEVGTELEVELLDVEPGNTITLDRVLLVADGEDASIGRPLVANAAVSAEVLRQARGEKTISFKYRPKARSRVKKGHRQELTILRISDITLDGKSAAKAADKAREAEKTERVRLEEAAARQAAADAALAAKLAEKSAPKAAETGAPARKGRAKASAGGEATAEPTGEESTADAPVEATETTEATEATEPKTPKRARATAADADTAAAPKPKRTRTTKKDE